MAFPQVGLSNDELLSTTRAVRKRLDLDRPVPRDLLKECLELAVQAPSGSNAQRWQFMFVTDPEKKSAIGEYYSRAFDVYRELPGAAHHLHRESHDARLKNSQAQVKDSAEYLAQNMGRVPAMLIPCIPGRTDTPQTSSAIAQAGTLGSIIPATWSFMLAARARGLGTSWTTLHLMFEREVASLLGIPYDEYMQVALIPIAYTRGTDFKPAYRPPVDSVMHFDQW